MPDWPLLYLASEWLIRLAMLLYVPDRRTPSAARAWLLLIFVFPWPGLALYAVIGRTYLSRRRQVLQVRASQAIRTRGQAYFQKFTIRPAVLPQFERIVQLAERLSDLPIVAGNSIEFETDYRAAIDRLIADIDGAARHVHLLYYIFADDAVGEQVIAALERAVGRGVCCIVLFDSFGSKRWRRRLRRRLRNTGVETIELMRFRWWRFRLWKRRNSRPDLRNHRKIGVIDGAVAYAGSQNLVDPNFKPGITYHELVARATGPIAAQLQAVLLTDYFLETGRPADEGSVFDGIAVQGDAAAQILPTGPGYAQANQARLLVALVHAAQRRVVITTPYFIPDEALVQALALAVLRGVDVRLVVSRKADQLLVGLGQRSFYEELLEAGVQIFEFSPGLLHAKHQLFDDEIAIIGSSNIDIRSFLLNAEVSMIVYDRQVAGRLLAEHERNLAHCQPIQIADWRERSRFARACQNLARLVDSLL